MFELPNIVFSPMFTWFGCARQNVALVMEWFRDFCPDVVDPCGWSGWPDCLDGADEADLTVDGKVES